MTGGHSFLGIFDRGSLKWGSPIPATTVFELFWINASVLSHSQPDLLSLSRDPRFQTQKLSTFLTCLASSRNRNRIYEGV